MEEVAESFMLGKKNRINLKSQQESKKEEKSMDKTRKEEEAL